MKKSILLSVMAILFTAVFAKAEWRPVKYRMDEPVRVTVRGIDFFVFPDGEFDFNAHNRRHFDHHFGVRIERDRTGKIRRIGNVFLNYNRYGQVKRIGHLFIRYNKRGLVSRIGHYKLRYRPFGYIVTDWRPGYVSTVSYYYGPAEGYQGGTCSTNDDFFNGDPFFEEDYATGYQDDYTGGYQDDEYYYRSPDREKKPKKGHKKRKMKLRKRRKR